MIDNFSAFVNIRTPKIFFFKLNVPTVKKILFFRIFKVNTVYMYNCDRKLYKVESGEPGLVDRALTLHAGSRGFDSHRGHMSKRFFRSNRPGYPHPVSSELEISGIRVAVGDCSVTERLRWRPPYQTGKTVHVHANTTNTMRMDARRRACAAMVPYR